MKLGLAKDVLVKIMKRYDSLGKVYPVKNGINYGKSKLIPNASVLKIVEELYGTG